MKVVTRVTALAIVIATCSGGATPIRSALRTRFGLEEKVPYEVVKQHEGFEERLYPAQKWVTTTREGPSKDALTSPMFRQLYRYIAGNNSINATINMTTPVTTHVSPAGPSNFRFTMGFYVPQIHQADPPTGGDDVFIEERPELRVLTKQFDGYAEGEAVTREAERLASVIRESGQTGVDFEHYYVVVYDPPFKFTDRTNEIWYVKSSA